MNRSQANLRFYAVTNERALIFRANDSTALINASILPAKINGFARVQSKKWPDVRLRKQSRTRYFIGPLGKAFMSHFELGFWGVEDPDGAVEAIQTLLAKAPKPDLVMQVSTAQTEL